ncbi:MAG TPA: serine hydrolase [Chitinophagaceae bacterium]|nr:serine hydrolase [Chitinophagaceae bacterium]
MTKLPEKGDSFITDFLHLHPQYFDSLLRNQDEYGIQIIYTQIDRKKNGKPLLTDHFFNINDKYFYPASTVKLPVALLALQELNRLKRKKIDINTSMITETAYSGQSAVYNDPTAADGRPTIAQYIKKIFLVSDNDAFNRLYEFLGQENINKSLHKLGYKDAEIIHRLSISLTEDENRHTNPISFFDISGHVIYQKPLETSQWIYAKRNDKRGKGYYSGNKLIMEPFDFSKKNRLSLVDLHSMLKTVFFPKEFKKSQRFKLKKKDYQFVYKYMSMFPRESAYPSYDSSYSDAYSRFILWGERKEKQTGNIRIFHKSGEAYGFLTDVCYVVDFENENEFMLSATIHCNSDGIYNDDHYDYETVGFPFMKNLGQVFYDYELKREKKYKPDLSWLKFDYTE